MNWLFEKMLGLKPAPWGVGERWQLEWVGLPSGDTALLVLAGIVAAVAGFWWLYRFDARHLRQLQRAGLLVIRTVIFAAVVAMLLEPVVVLSKTEHVPSNLLVLLDVSQSMGLKDTWPDEAQAKAITAAAGLTDQKPGDLSRLDLAKRVIESKLLKPLADDGRRTLRLHIFSDRLSDTAIDPGSTIKTSGGGGGATAISAAIRQALTAYRGMPLSGVLLVTDGQSNSGPSITEAAQSLTGEGVPIVALATGTPEGPRNVRIVKVEADPVVFVRDTNHLNVLLESRGMSAAPATVVLSQRRDAGPWQEVGRREIALELDGRMQTVTFDFAEERPAKLEFRAVVEDAGAELTTDDNTGVAEVRVIREKLRVLMVAGTSFPEVQFLRNTLIRDRTVEVSTWLQSADEKYEQPGDKPIRRLPSTLEELGEFDCVILYDPDASVAGGWPEGFSQMLTDFVGKLGGGLIYIAGEAYTSALFDNVTDPANSWVNILPVVREPGLFRSAVQIKLSAQNDWRLDVTAEGRKDPIFAFAKDPEQNQRVIESLPGMYWHFPVTRAKPGATVLARHGDPRMRNEFGAEVLLATQLIGPGRTFFVAFDSTYRWRYLDEQFFDGFWARMIDRAGRTKQLGGAYPFRLSSDRTDYRPGQQATITAEFTDPSQRDASIDVLHGEIERGDDPPVPITLTPAPGSENIFEAHFTPERAGPHLVRIWAGEDAVKAVLRPATMKLDVQLPNLEFDHPGLDRAALDTLASATGGAVFTLAEADRIPAAFRVSEVARELEDRQEIWHAPLLLLVIFGGLLAEWLIRKKYRLI